MSAAPAPCAGRDRLVSQEQVHRSRCFAARSCELCERVREALLRARGHRLGVDEGRVDGTPRVVPKARHGQARRRLPERGQIPAEGDGIQHLGEGVVVSRQKGTTHRSRRSRRGRGRTGAGGNDRSRPQQSPSVGDSASHGPQSGAARPYPPCASWPSTQAVARATRLSLADPSHPTVDCRETGRALPRLS